MLSRAAARLVVLPWLLCSLLLLVLVAEAQDADGELPDEVQECQEECPVHLLTVPDDPQGGSEGQALALDPAGLAYLEKQRSPLYLMPALGVYRGGKSTLLNRVMGLEAPYTGGFGVGHTISTFTRGINVCAEKLPNGEGTVVWMDTEGLFSAEEARGAYGMKIFSLSMLFSSAVLLNSRQTFSEQFFQFFEEQQKVARMLRQGLKDEGLSGAWLMPENLTLVWTLQQPVSYDPTSQASKKQLDDFLSMKDEARARVQRDFKHLAYEVPHASHDARVWRKLETVPDEDLLPEYVEAGKRLRELLLSELKSSRPLQAVGIGKVLRMYVDLVQNDRFSGTLAHEAFEDGQLSQLCDRFGTLAQEHVGKLPSRNLPDAFAYAEELLQEQTKMVMEEFHLGATWKQKLATCMRGKREDLTNRNSELVLESFKAEALAAAQSESCFFLSRLALSLQEYEAKYGLAFNEAAKAKAIEYGSDLQRTKLGECVRLRDFLHPFAPWLAWPVMGTYLRMGGSLPGLFMMCVGLVGVYGMLQWFNQVPAFLDTDYRVLKHSASLRALVMHAPPRLPWSHLANAFGTAGLLRSGYYFLRSVRDAMRGPGEGFSVEQMVNLELKLNTLLKRSEAVLKQKMVSSAIEASCRIQSGDAQAAALALVKCLVLVSEVDSSDHALASLVEEKHRQQARRAIENFRPPPAWKEPSPASVKHCARLPQLVVQGDWPKLLPVMVDLLKQLAQAQDESYWREQIEAVYRRTKREKKMDDVPKMIAEYKAKGIQPPQLYVKVCQANGLDSKVFWANVPLDVQEAESEEVEAAAPVRSWSSLVPLGERMFGLATGPDEASSDAGSPSASPSPVQSASPSPSPGLTSEGSVLLCSEEELAGTRKSLFQDGGLDESLASVGTSDVRDSESSGEDDDEIVQKSDGCRTCAMILATLGGIGISALLLLCGGAAGMLPAETKVPA
eukprot:TRINITY_DN10794_c0_g3_i1.p1 TRINITY_DN10794_c0_g3~~TRINITY_DN10794_c0_g3_i1.p1  ORF type:complete len:967 (-),score=237.48 TRINITY_DN10794_c0_g3_i1:68-2935(-)